eukprot:scaffold4559_cov159-Skeletonema_marinoi.AAC.3
MAEAEAHCDDNVKKAETETQCQRKRFIKIQIPVVSTTTFSRSQASHLRTEDSSAKLLVATYIPYLSSSTKYCLDQRIL